MPIRFDVETDHDTFTPEVMALIHDVGKLINSGDYDIRSVYTALAMLVEIHRQKLRNVMSDKLEFDSFIDSMNIYINSLTNEALKHDQI